MYANFRDKFELYVCIVFHSLAQNNGYSEMRVTAKERDNWQFLTAVITVEPAHL